MLEESLKQSFVMPEEAVDKALSSAPGKKELKRHLHRYFGCVRKFRAIAMRGQLAKTTEIDEVSDCIKACKEESTAFGQELADVGVISETLTLPLLVAQLDSMAFKLNTLKQGNHTANQNALKSLNAEMRKVLKQVDITNENKFKDAMKKYGDKIGGVQAKIKGVFNITQTENPFVIDAESTASGQTGLQSVCADSAKLESAVAVLLNDEHVVVGLHFGLRVIPGRVGVGMHVFVPGAAFVGDVIEAAVSMITIRYVNSIVVIDINRRIAADQICRCVKANLIQTTSVIVSQVKPSTNVSWT